MVEWQISKYVVEGKSSKTLGIWSWDWERVCTFLPQLYGNDSLSTSDLVYFPFINKAPLSRLLKETELFLVGLSYWMPNKRNYFLYKKIKHTLSQKLAIDIWLNLDIIIIFFQPSLLLGQMLTWEPDVILIKYFSILSSR